MSLPLLLVMLITPLVPQSIAYGDLYGWGVTYEEFLKRVDARAADWRRTTAAATVSDEALERVRGMASPRKLLVVAEASCSDSVGTIPYLAKLAELAPDRLELRIVNSRAGRPVMQAHRAPDGRAATPTVVVLDQHGAFVAAWIERPTDLQRWYDERKGTPARELTAEKLKWYAADAGRSTVSEIVALLTGPG